MSPRLTRLRILALVYAGNFDRVQLFMALVALAWGAHVLWPSPSFEHAEHYRVLDRLAPEWFWGLTVFALGAAKLAVLLFGTARARGRMSWVAAGVWTFLALSFAIANPYAATSSVFAVFAISSAWICLRLM